MKKAGILLAAILMWTSVVHAQIDEESDSLTLDDFDEFVDLDDIVITGQYSSQSIDKSIYKVDVISRQDIENFAGNTVADVLNHNLNILIIPSSDGGQSHVNIMGLGGEYTKILIDNIPVVGEDGMGINIDLTQLNLDNIDRIEIVKGAMGVDYGNNALTGVINIITKKSIRQKWRINTFVQEETVNSEYDWYKKTGATKGKGRHVQSLEISHNISDDWFASIGINRNDFMGYWGEKTGSKTIIDRGYEWLPKKNYNANFALNYRTRAFKVFYRTNFMHEDIKYINPNINMRSFDDGFQTYIANDRNYKTDRWVHHLNIETKFFDRIRFIGDFSYQTQDKKLQNYVFDIPSRKIISENDFISYASSKAIYSRGTFSNFLNKPKFDFQIGYEIDATRGFRNALSGDFRRDVDEKLGTYAGFVSAEIKTDMGLSFRPGVRANFSNKFKEQMNFSLSARYNLSQNRDLRAVFGTTNRYPDFDELYTYMVDVNHDIRGNRDLEPEKGFTTSLQWTYKGSMGDLKMNGNVNTIYLDVDDKIELAAISFSPLKYQYINIDKYRAWGINSDHRFTYDDLSVGLGISLLGISRGLGEIAGVQPKDDFRYTFEANASVNYKIPKWDTTLSAYYKYAGKKSQYVLEDALGDNPFYRLGTQAAYHLTDISARKGFWDDRFELTLGVRNLFDVTSVDSTMDSGDLHSDAPDKIMLFYGRSYFIKLSYTLDFK